MAKTKSQKELLSKVKESTLAYNYDLTCVDPREFAAPLSLLFESTQWHDMFARRVKLFRAATVADNNAFKQMEQIDKKAAWLLLQTMFQYCQSRKNQIDGRTVTLNEYFTDFVRTPEQHELYDQFSLALDSALLLSDIMESLLIECRDTLQKLDPALVLQEFDALNKAVNFLGDFSHLQHRDEHIELQSLFADNADEIEEYLKMKSAVFIKIYQEKRTALINSGQIKEKTINKHTDREYLIDLLSNYYYIMKNFQKQNTDSKKKAEKAIALFTDEELPELMPVVIDLYRQSEAIHMAKDRLNVLVHNLPNTPLTVKICENII